MRLGTITWPATERTGGTASRRHGLQQAGMVRLVGTATVGGHPGTVRGANHHVDLAITGMTCASCAARVEKKLNKLDGVAATVNLATESARVTFPATLSIADLVSVVEQAGYGAQTSALAEA